VSEVGREPAQYDVAVIGGGLLGLSTANQLLRLRPRLRLVVLEKESELARHQSGRNSGVIHSGLYYAPGSLKARLCREGKAELERLAEAEGIPYRVCGKVVVAREESELGRLADLAARGAANGVEGLHEIRPEELRELEPHVVGVRALHAPRTGVIDFRRVALAYAAQVERAGGAILLDHEVRTIVERRGAHDLGTSRGEVAARHLISCAGAHSDRVAAMTGAGSGNHRIFPFRGDYYVLAPEAARLVRGLVYPVPDPGFPFLGVHFTRRIDDEVWAGPNAVPALGREAYGRLSGSLRDVAGSASFPGFWRLAARYWRMGALEIWRDFVKPAYVREMRRYIPELEGRHVRLGPSGIRAQALARDGSLADDFVFESSSGALHVVNAPSPGATASPAIGRMIAEHTIEQFSL
jgi:L-2-hydroxyglutarate oxidase